MRDLNRHAGESQSSEGPRPPTEFDVRTDDELSLAEKVAKFPQHKRDQIFAGYTQADFASLSSIHDRPGYSRSVPLADVATHCNRLVRGQQYGLLCASIEWQHDPSGGLKSS